MNIFAFVGSEFFKSIKGLGEATLTGLKVVIKVVTPPYYLKRFLAQVLEIGFFSLPIVFLTALFAGMVLALQAYTSFSVFPSETIIANVVAVALVRELAPVLVSLMVAGRVSSAIAAQIGSMKVTEQLSALKMLSVRPIKYLVAPNILAGLVCLPILVLLADLVGIMGGYLVAVAKLNFNGNIYLTASYNFITFNDILSSFFKSLVFGFILTAFGCYYGFNTKNSAQGVGSATTHAVVAASIFIFVADYILTVIFFGTR